MLTERQRWDIVRSLIKQSDEEFNSFLFRFFDPVQIKFIKASLRDNFLDQWCNGSMALIVNSEGAKDNSNSSKIKWIDNLSSEELLLFLDYRCRVLKQVYKHYKTHRNITKHDINYISANTLVNKLAMCNDNRLTCTGRPEKRENELSLKDLEGKLGIDIYTLRRPAINQIVDELMEKCVKSNNLSLDQVYQYASALVTHNVDLMGHVTGCTYNIEQSEFLESAFYMPSPKHRGFDIQGSPVYEYEDEYYSSSGSKMSDDDIIFKSIDDEFTF